MKYELKDEPEYLQILIGKCWKVLKLYEEKSSTLPKYIEITIGKFEGAEENFNELNGRIEFFEVLNMLKKLRQMLVKPIYDEKTHSLIRAFVFDCTNTLQRLGSRGDVK